MRLFDSQCSLAYAMIVFRESDPIISLFRLDGEPLR